MGGGALILMHPLSASAANVRSTLSLEFKQDEFRPRLLGLSSNGESSVTSSICCLKGWERAGAGSGRVQGERSGRWERGLRAGAGSGGWERGHSGRSWGLGAGAGREGTAGVAGG